MAYFYTASELTAFFTFLKACGGEKKQHHMQCTKPKIFTVFPFTENASLLKAICACGEIGMTCTPTEAGV